MIGPIRPHPHGLCSSGFSQIRVSQIRVKYTMPKTAAVLNSPRFSDEVNASLQWCAQASISGVPCFRLGDGEVIQGAQPVSVFQMLLESCADSR